MKTIAICLTLLAACTNSPHRVPVDAPPTETTVHFEQCISGTWCPDPSIYGIQFADDWCGETNDGLCYPAFCDWCDGRFPPCRNPANTTECFPGYGDQ